MNMKICAGLCDEYYMEGYCPNQDIAMVSDTEIDNTEFIRDVRAFAYSLKKTRDEWADFLIDQYRDFTGRLVDQNGHELFIADTVFEAFSCQNSRYWFRDFCCIPCPENVKPRVKSQARERVRALASILRANNPYEAAFWGLKGSAANDNAPD